MSLVSLRFVHLVVALSLLSLLDVFLRKHLELSRAELPSLRSIWRGFLLGTQPVTNRTFWRRLPLDAHEFHRLFDACRTKRQHFPHNASWSPPGFARQGQWLVWGGCWSNWLLSPLKTREKIGNSH
jgi:hypothetical protein